MPRFILLYHDCPPGYERPSHWDLMLESGDGLETWALLELPRAWQAAHDNTTKRFPECAPLSNSNTVSAEHLARHRLAYLEYEGAVSGGRGDVYRVAAGTLQALHQTVGLWQLAFDAGALTGHVTLEKASNDARRWRVRAAAD